MREPIRRFGGIMLGGLLILSCVAARAQVPGIDALDTFGTIGRAGVDIDGMNRSFSGDFGYPTLPAAATSIGLMSQARVGRFLGAWEEHYLLEVKRSDAVHSTAMSGLVMFGDVGYDVYRRGDLSVHPFLGVGYGRMDLSVWNNAAPSDYAGLLSDPAHGTSLHKWMYVAQVGVGVQQFVPVYSHANGAVGVVVALVAGYVEATNVDWRWRTTALANSAEAGLTGPYVRLMLGLGTRGCTCGG